MSELPPTLPSSALPCLCLRSGLIPSAHLELGACETRILQCKGQPGCDCPPCVRKHQSFLSLSPRLRQVQLSRTQSLVFTPWPGPASLLANGRGTPPLGAALQVGAKALRHAHCWDDALGHWVCMGHWCSSSGHERG